MAVLWLVGMMGSGKSEVGGIVASALGVPFIDTDTQIESLEDRPISALWEEKGEDGFRELEAAVIDRIAGERGEAVVATGGGAVLRNENVAAMRRTGTVVWLAGETSELAERLAASEHRPLLAGQDVSVRLSEILVDRERAYRAAAHHVIDTTEQTPPAVAARVVELWNAS